MVAESEQRGKEVEKDGGVDSVNLFPDSIVDLVRARRRSVRGFAKSARYLFRLERWGVRVNPEKGGREGRRFGGKEVVEERSVEFRRGGCIGEGGEFIGIPAFGESLGRPHRFGVDLGEKSFPMIGFRPLYGFEVGCFGGAGLRKGGGGRVPAVSAGRAVEVLA